MATPEANTPPGPFTMAAPYSADEAYKVPAIIRANTASIISTNITPPPTGLASSSFSSCLAVPEEDTRLCHPDMAPVSYTHLRAHET
ncbi:MAG: hypothetical protein N3D15_02525, partial [Syntrophorhabdaceae bacterium]|nr:hypothetical protein [Syntrophorhabdaceae bacterium]